MAKVCYIYLGGKSPDIDVVFDDGKIKIAVDMRAKGVRMSSAKLRPHADRFLVTQGDGKYIVMGLPVEIDSRRLYYHYRNGVLYIEAPVKT